MEGMGQTCYNMGVELFEGGYYEQAVKMFIQAYNLGYDRQRILEDLYSCFVWPNEEEFRNNYSQNSEGINKLPFEACTMDFIPVSEKRFYIFDREEQAFAGMFELEDEPLWGEREEFGNILFADIWDIREMIPDMKECNWSLVYVVLNEQAPKFLSFFKLPGFKKLYLENVALFPTTELMYAIFEQYDDFYLPKKVVAKQAEKYLNLIRELHEKRICDTAAERNSVFLSVCIPSYNRGSFALKNVRHLLHCIYDSEIEFIISNNGSTEDAEGYEEISRIRDSRITYHAFETNQGFASNILKTLELAKGKYAVLTSDEDLMILEQMGEYLNYLKKYSSCGVFCMGSIGGEFAKASQNLLYKAGISAIMKIINLNYMTGVTFNTDILKNAHAFEIIEKMRGNDFLEYYPHITLAMTLGKLADFFSLSLVLWDIRNAERNDFLPRYMLPETRIAQQNGAMEFCRKAIEFSENELINILLDRFGKTYVLLEIAYYTNNKFREFYSWEEICFYVYRKQKEYLEIGLADLSEEKLKKIRKLLQEWFLKKIRSERILSMFPLTEQENKKALCQKIQDMFEEGKTLEEAEDSIMEEYHLQRIDGKRPETAIMDTFMVNSKNLDV